MSDEFRFGPGQQKLLAGYLKQHLDQFCADFYEEGPRWHLGASMIGKECSRDLWYSFRWVLKPTYINAKGENIEGRMKRLFNRGHKEEFRFIEWLRGMGHIVEEFEPTSRLYFDHSTNTYFVSDVPPVDSNAAEDVTDMKFHEENAASAGVKRKQFRISGVNGHYGGSADGKIVLVGSMYEGLPKMLLEFKTSGSKYFDKLVENGVKVQKGEHFAQMSSYGKRFGLRYALYMCVNKDTDDIYYEIVELDWRVSDMMDEKAHRIINSATPPEKISQNSAYLTCKMCKHAPVCHGRTPYDVNCRSCAFAQPVEGGEWFCHKFQNIIPRDFVPKGCTSHKEAR